MFSALLRIFGLLLIIFGLAMLPPALASLVYDDGHARFFLVTAAAAIAVGALGSLGLLRKGSPRACIADPGWISHRRARVVLDEPAFMLLGAISFAVHFRAWSLSGVQPYRNSAETRVFVMTVAALILFITVVLSTDGGRDLVPAFRVAAFQVVSVITSTGYGIEDFSLWPGLLPVLLIFTSFIGGCAGSTAGGMKVVRFLVMTRQAVIEVTRLIHPRLVQPLKLDGSVLGEDIVRAVWSFFTVYVFVFVILMLTLMWLGLDQATAFSAVATCINNLGAGAGRSRGEFRSRRRPCETGLRLCLHPRAAGDADDLRAVHARILATLSIGSAVRRRGRE